jgi:hypothetical protein
VARTAQLLVDEGALGADNVWRRSVGGSIAAALLHPVEESQVGRLGHMG